MQRLRTTDPFPASSFHGSQAGQSEEILLRLHPHPLFIILRPLGLLALVIVLTASAHWFAIIFSAPAVASGSIQFAGLLLAAILIWNGMVRAMRSYTLTTHRLIRTAGIFRRSRLEIPLSRIQHLQLYRSLRERLFGLGTLGFSAAGTGNIEMIWFMIARPEQHLALVRDAIEIPRSGPHAGSAYEPTGVRQVIVQASFGAGTGEGTEQQDPRKPSSSSDAPAAHLSLTPSEPSSSSRPPSHSPLPSLPVIGLAGGIGSGKSEVARIFDELGCFVIDSDRQARAALDRPDVREQLIRWWGRGILNDQGRVDRSEVARIVFSDSRERARLEALVHPIVRARRSELIAEARARGAAAAIVDAPLLFEAGVDQECDAVVFIDAPRDLRLKRLRDSRGWNEAELDRREHAQLPLEEKRRRSHFIIANTGDPLALAKQVERVLREVRRRGH